MKFHSPRTAFALCLTALVLPGSALAGAGELTVAVVPLTTAVTYSAPASASPPRPALTTYVGYTVNVSNTGGNTINNIRLTGAAHPTDADEKALIDSVEGGSCTIGADQISIDCSLGQLKAGQPYPQFAVFFKAPIKDTASPLPNGVAAKCDQTDCVSFGGSIIYAEAGGGPTSPPQNSIKPWAATPVTLGTTNSLLVKSAVPKGGATLFTGAGGNSTGNDPFATSVVVQGGATFTTAEIQESPDNINCTNNFSACFRADITIPGTFAPYLTIVLRQDASTILSGVKIESVLIQYSGESGTGIVGDCANATTPRTDGFPCIAKRTFYKSKQTPGWTLELDGDFEWTLLNIRNGSYKVF